MTEIECPYCHTMSNDFEFCDECGRNIQNVVDVSNSTNEGYFNEKWISSTFSMQCYTIESNNEVSTTNNLKLLDEYIEFPFYCESKNEKYLLYFKKENNVQNLSTWINNNNYASMEDIITIIKRICLIIQSINHKTYIVGTFDLSDFWLKDNDISTIFLRVVRPFYKTGKLINNMNLGEFTALEIINNSEDDINYSCDVFIIGSLLINLLLRKNNFDNYTELRYLAHQLELFAEDIPIGLHKWIGISTSIVAKNRFKGVHEQLNQLNKILSVERKRKAFDNDVVYELDYYSETNAGEGKRIKFHLDTPEYVINEDRIITLKDENGENNKFLSIIADGISNCKYGSGADAAQHVIDVAKELWDNRSSSLNSDHAIELFFKALIKESNKRILDEVDTMSKQLAIKEEILPSEVMGSTLVAVFIENNTVYSVSIGDSRTYLYSIKGMNLIHSDDNVLNESLKNNYSWDDVQNMEEKFSLTNHIGKILDLKEDIKIKIKKFKLFEDEILLLCSDGLSDYINSIEYKNDEWNIDKKFEEILKKERNGKNSLDKISHTLVNEANINGGGDNISLVLIRLKRIKA